MADRTHQQAPGHDPRTCNLCGIYRHPAQAAKGRALREHLAQQPFPRQTNGAQR